MFASANGLGDSSLECEGCVAFRFRGSRQGVYRHPRLCEARRLGFLKHQKESLPEFGEFMENIEWAS